MPTVPRYDGPQVAPTGLPGVRQSSAASPELLGAGGRQLSELGRGLAVAGSAANNIAIRLQEQENADKVFQAEAALKDEWLKFEQSARERRGQNAWGLTNDTDKWFGEQAKTHGQNLTNDVQRKLFGQQIARLRQSAMSSMAGYESQERERSLNESAQASIVGSINLAAADPKQVPTAKADILKRVDVLSQLGGWSPEMREAKAAEYLTNLHKQVLQGMVDKDAKGAKAYYEANKAEINGTDRDGIEKVLKIGGLRQIAQEAADAVTAMNMTEPEALEHARKNYEGEEEQAVVTEIKTRFAENQQAADLVQKQAGDRAWKAYSMTGKLSSVSAADIADMDGKDWEALKAHAREVARGVTTKTDPTTYYDLRQLAAGDPDTFQRTDLRRFINKLSPEDFQEFVKLQTGAETRKDAATLDAQLSNTHDLLGWGAGDKEKKGAFDKAVTDAVNAEQRRLGKSLSYEERQGIIDRLTIQGEVPGFWNDREMRLFEVTPTDAPNWRPSINDADREQIKSNFKKKWNRDPSDDEVMQVYRQWKGL